MATTLHAREPATEHDQLTPFARLTPTGWDAREDLPFDRWAELGRRFGVIGRGANWWIGDWLRFGNLRFGERYGRASRITGYDPQTLMNMVYVASRIEHAQRRDNLSWSHHAEVAALDPEDRVLWLDRAERERMSVRCLRHEIRELRRTTRREVGLAAAAAEIEAATTATTATTATAATAATTATAATAATVTTTTGVAEPAGPEPAGDMTAEAHAHATKCPHCGGSID